MANEKGSQQLKKSCSRNFPSFFSVTCYTLQLSERKITYIFLPYLSVDTGGDKINCCEIEMSAGILQLHTATVCESFAVPVMPYAALKENKMS